MPPRSQGPTNVTLFVAHEIERAREQELATFADLARKWGVTRAHLANITNHLTGVGSDFEQKLANAWTGGSVDELRRRADEWRKANPTWTPKAVGERKTESDVEAASIQRRSWGPRSAERVPQGQRPSGGARSGLLVPRRSHDARPFAPALGQDDDPAPSRPGATLVPHLDA